MNDNVFAVPPLALRIETRTFHSSKGVMLRFPFNLLETPELSLLRHLIHIDSSMLTLRFVILFTLTHLRLLFASSSCSH